MKKLTWADKKFGEICKKCGLRKGTIMTTSAAEGGRDSVCKCKNEK